MNENILLSSIRILQLKIFYKYEAIYTHVTHDFFPVLGTIVIQYTYIALIFIFAVRKTESISK